MSITFLEDYKYISFSVTLIFIQGHWSSGKVKLTVHKYISEIMVSIEPKFSMNAISRKEDFSHVSSDDMILIQGKISGAS